MSTAPTVNCPLDGINLIEAAAGTGKTYNIQNLVVRYILETDCTIDQLAVVSYTVPAAAELKDRLRKVLQAVKSEIECSDSTQSQQAKDLLSRSRSCGIPPKIAAAKINRALEDFDLAQVCTIHGFCQKILADCALDCGESFSARLDNDKKALLSPIIDDCRRRYLYGDDGWILQALLKQAGENVVPPEAVKQLNAALQKVKK